MTLPKVKAARELSDEDLLQQIIAVKKELFDLRLKKATRQPVQPHQFGHAKHRLGQLMTVERERQLTKQDSSGEA
jgi:large subunit ribosomal protein L29